MLCFNKRVQRERHSLKHPNKENTVRTVEMASGNIEDLWKVRPGSLEHTDVPKDRSALIFKVKQPAGHFFNCLTLKIKIIRTFDTSEIIYQSTRCNMR
jgi:hypothetical protein